MKQIFLFIIGLWTCVAVAQPPGPLILWDDRPATDWMTQAYPIGNGRLGAMIFGGPASEHIQFNENSLWTGDEKETGAYQAFGDLYIDFERIDTSSVQHYTRKLDMKKAIHQVDFQTAETRYHRTYFASHPDQVIVLEYGASGRAGYCGTIRLSDAHGAAATGDNAQLRFSGMLENGLSYAAAVHIAHQDGTVRFEKDADGQAKLRLEGVTTFQLVLAAATDYDNSRSKHWRSGEDPEELVQQQIAGAKRRSVKQLEKRHVQDYQSLFNRFSLDIGSPAAETNKPTRQRILDYKKDGDPSLEVLLTQYGRYLLISSSRKGGLPANLQGLWNNSNNPPWRSDYHSNINVQMNYWPAEVSNLAECHFPYLDYINAMREVKKENTQAEFPGVRGWTVRTENNIFGGESFNWNTPGSAWYAQALWEHYAFSQDKAYLRNFAYPILKEICEFWDDRLKRRDDGTVVAPDGWSPEHGPVEDGVSYDQQIIYDLFTNYIEACDSLQLDSTYRNHIADLRNRLLKPQIGSWGQLQEWETDRDDPQNDHRHVSHLFALHPGRQISINRTPELAAAARVSLTARGDESTGWSMAWKMNFWARLHDGNHAHKILRNFITLVGGNPDDINYNEGGGVYENLLCAHPPFQIDGNLGYVAGVAEMLLQSHEGFVDLLPAIPDAWKSEGEVSGLRARGDVTVDMKWKDGAVQRYKLYTKNGKRVKVKVNGELKTIKTSKL